MDKERENTNKRNILVSRCIFSIYLILVVYVMFFAENFGRVSGSEEYRYNITPFVEINRFMTLILNDLSNYKAWLNLAGNVVAFVPFGLFFPMLRNKHTGIINTVILTFVFSSMIEIIQLYTKIGVFDVDDIILNTLGGFVGYLIYITGRAIHGRHR